MQVRRRGIEEERGRKGGMEERQGKDMEGRGHTNPMKFGQLLLRKIINIVATRCQILRLKCTKVDFG